MEGSWVNNPSLDYNWDRSNRRKEQALESAKVLIGHVPEEKDVSLGRK